MYNQQRLAYPGHMSASTKQNSSRFIQQNEDYARREIRYFEGAFVASMRKRRTHPHAPLRLKLHGFDERGSNDAGGGKLLDCA
eukprot:3719609-Pleurochrysis_carterae.AAC.1